MAPVIYRPGFTAHDFLALANRVWPGSYDVTQTEAALARTINIGPGTV